MLTVRNYKYHYFLLYTAQEVALAVMAHAGAGASHEIDCALAVLSGTTSMLLRALCVRLHF
jgi:hypothetical protein